MMNGSEPASRRCEPAHANDPAAVDDVPQNLKAARRHPHSAGYRVITAASGAEALDTVAAEHPTSCCSTS